MIEAIKVTRRLDKGRLNLPRDFREEVYSKPLKDVIEALELSDMKVHTDEGGNVKAIELKYTEKKAESEPKTNPWA